MSWARNSYLLSSTSVFAKPVTVAFESDELMLTGPSPWKILIRFNFIGSIVSIAVNPSIPKLTHKQNEIELGRMENIKCIDIQMRWECIETLPVTNCLNKPWMVSREQASKLGSSIWHVFSQSSVINQSQRNRLI